MNSLFWAEPMTSFIRKNIDMHFISKKFKYILEVGQGNFDHAGRPGLVGGSALNSGDLTIDDISIDFIQGNLNSRPYSDIQSIRNISFIKENPGDTFVATVIKDTVAETLRYPSSSDLRMSITEQIAKETDIDAYTISCMMGQWIATSNDSDYASLFMQKCASEEFGIPLSAYQLDKLKIFDDKIAELLKMPGMSADILKTLGEKRKEGWDRTDVISFLDNNDVSRGDGRLVADFILDSSNSAFTDANTTKRFLRCIYDKTQKAFAEQGISKVYLARGVKEESDLPEGASKWEGNTMESWTTSTVIASQFESETNPNAKSIYAAVPVKRIISTCVTGFGSLHEKEFVVLGGGTHDVIFRKKTGTFFNELGNQD